MKRVLITTGIMLLTFFVLAAVEDNIWKMGDTRRAEVESVSSSSELEEAQYAGKYVYPPAFVLDGNFMTCWAEAEKGSGIGQSLTIGFRKPVSFDEIQIANGLAGKRYYYFANNRVTRIRIAQKAGKHFQSQVFNLRDGVVGWQSIRFAKPQTVENIVFTILKVARGTKYNDTCISDIRFRYKGRVIPFRGHRPLIRFQKRMAKQRIKSRIGHVSLFQFEKLYIGKNFYSPVTGLTYFFAADGNFIVDRDGAYGYRSSSGNFRYEPAGGRLFFSQYVSYVKIKRVMYFQARGRSGFLLNGILYRKK